jgi:hypothetical protein
MINKAEHLLRNALVMILQTVKETRVNYGGQWVEMFMANVVDDEWPKGNCRLKLFSCSLSASYRLAQ